MYNFPNIAIFVLVSIILPLTNAYSEESAICQSESDCDQVCQEYAQQLNSDDNIPNIYSCQITGFQQVGTIEADGTTTTHTEYNCLCTPVGVKADGGSDDGGGSGKPAPPDILNPLIPDFPGGFLPPDNGYMDCLEKANKVMRDMLDNCYNEIVQDWTPDLSNEEMKEKKVDFVRSSIICINKAKEVGREMKEECHKKWSKKSIGNLIPLENVK